MGAPRIWFPDRAADAYETTAGSSDGGRSDGLGESEVKRLSRVAPVCAGAGPRLRIVLKQETCPSFLAGPSPRTPPANASPPLRSAVMLEENPATAKPPRPIRRLLLF